MKKTLLALACALSLSSLSIGVAFAQNAPASAPAAASSATPHEARVEQRITYLHQQLKITPAQEQQWNAFADVMRNNGTTMANLYEQRKAATNQSALDDMKQYSDIAQAHADGMKKLVDAFEPLYNSFSPDQKKLADTTFHQTGEHHGHEHGHGKAAKPAQSQ
ncbi:Spy/CpxP family protein refolding chaperone [Paraburkholderia phosphatilytica]|uniref:Spy/CpxP family protein refolding chaperone n=1 Tax=Paraburkholderia phosphatilytica TaxID=2282883 RepID=UPI000E4FE443|nr:Spy/CpxP family protein refolding chaperone [Paraburkholderia phosphatilytica]